MSGIELFVIFSLYAGTSAHAQADESKIAQVPRATKIVMGDVFEYDRKDDLCSQFNKRGNYVHVECARLRGIYIPEEDVESWEANQ